MLIKDLLAPLATGLAIFLFGMQAMRLGFEQLFFKKAKHFLSRLMNSPVIGLFTGIVVTAILQSSSAVMLVVIGLAHAGIITLRQALGLMLGANIGTVVTIELITMPIDEWGIYLFLLGALLFLVSRYEVRSTGLVIGGFGLLFVGMEIMQTMTLALKELAWAKHLFQQLEYHAVHGILAGTLLTAVIQSSTATTGIVMNLIEQGMITIHAAIAAVLGSNIGTCATALLGSIATNRTGRQVAMAHLLFNVLGVLCFIPLISLLVVIVQYLTANPVVQVAHAQLIFNLVCSFAMLPFLTWFERLILWITVRPNYL